MTGCWSPPRPPITHNPGGQPGESRTMIRSSCPNTYLIHPKATFTQRVLLACEIKDRHVAPHLPSHKKAVLASFPQQTLKTCTLIVCRKARCKCSYNNAKMQCLTENICLKTQFAGNTLCECTIICLPVILKVTTVIHVWFGRGEKDGGRREEVLKQEWRHPNLTQLHTSAASAAPRRADQPEPHPDCTRPAESQPTTDTDWMELITSNLTHTHQTSALQHILLQLLFVLVWACCNLSNSLVSKVQIQGCMTIWAGSCKPSLTQKYKAKEPILPRLMENC